LQGEDYLRSSGLPFTIVRPCALTEEPEGADLVVEQGDAMVGKISREDVAELCCSLLDSPQCVGTTFEVKSTVPFSETFEGPGEAKAGVDRDWDAILAGLRKGVTGKTVGGVYTADRPEEDFAAETQA